MKETPIKDLTINGITYAKYTIDGEILFIKVLIPFIKSDVGKTEDLLHLLICNIEKVYCNKMAYLNI